MAAKWCLNTAVLLVLALSMEAHGAVTCNVAASGVAFGNYDVFNLASTDSTGAVNITCNDVGGGGKLNVLITIALSASATSGTVNNRQMALAGSTDRLNYNLYRDAAHSQIWGDTPGLNDLALPMLKVPNNGSAATSFMIYGSIPAGQDVTAGNYSDDNVLTIYY